MKSKKKIISIALILCMSAMMVLSGCDSKEDSKVEDSQTVESTTEEAEAISEDDFEKGTVTDTTFESSYLNLKFDLPEGFIMHTEEELLQLTNVSADNIGLDEDEYDYAMANTVYEMMASDLTGTPNIIVMEAKVDIENITDEEYLEQVKVGLESMGATAYEIEDDNETVSIAGQDYLSFTATTEVSGISMTQEYYTRKIGNRMASIIVSYDDNTIDEKDALMNSFTALE